MLALAHDLVSGDKKAQSECDSWRQESVEKRLEYALVKVAYCTFLEEYTRIFFQSCVPLKRF